jgi:hypothetical protein
MTLRDIIRLAAIGGVAVAFAPAALAQEGMFMKDLLGSVGIIPKERPPIDYRERAPLVLPPNMELRQPMDGAGLQAANPQWPNDPDVAAARRREADARVPVTETERRRSLGQNPSLSVHDIRAGRRAGAQVPDGPVATRLGNARDTLVVDPRELKATGSDKEASLSSLEEPERASLTEPPTGFRKPTQRVKPTFEIEHKADEADPKAYWAEQRQRR